MSLSDDEAFPLDMPTHDSDPELDPLQDDDSDDGIVMEPPPGNGSRADQDFAYSVLSPEEIVREMCTMIKEVEQVVHGLELPQVVSPLTRHHSSGAPSTSNPSSGRPTIYRPAPNSECAICLLMWHNSDMAGLQCGHKFCKDCWQQYLKIKIMDEGKGQQICCPDSKCNILVDDDLVMKLVTDERVRRRYQHHITESFVSANKRMRWCPGRDCGNALRAECNEMRLVRCKCGSEFCFSCARDWHEPVPCDLLEKWLKKCSDDSETSNWIYTNTKECPKCKVTIEKDGGCNHMTCKSLSCQYQFCWMCLGAWEPHGQSWYQCNRYDDRGSQLARSDAEMRRAALKRYLHYWGRYQEHNQSRLLENKLYATVKHKMEQMQAAGQMSWIEVQYLRKAVDILCACRRTLMHTYVFAYYLVDDNQTRIFEDNQADLEMATEVLSGYLERELESEASADLVVLKQNVQDKAAYVDQRREALVKHTAEGMNKDWWRYRNDLFT